MGLSRNKVAVPEGAAGTPPFWRERYFKRFVCSDPMLLDYVLFIDIEKDEAER